MSTLNKSKINHLLFANPTGVVFQSDWLKATGYSPELQKRYRKSNWLKSIGKGAMIRNGDTVGYEGAIYALQMQSKLSIHPGARTALSFLGKAHYLELNVKKAILFGRKEDRLPTWFRKHDWGLVIEYHQNNFLPEHLGLCEIDRKSFSIKISDAPRALMECLYLSSETHDLLECYEIMEGLNNLRPTEVQMLLEKSESVKVNRLFLFFAEKAGHAWFNFLDTKKINLGSGKRSITKGGIYIPKYQITVPKEFEKHGK